MMRMSDSMLELYRKLRRMWQGKKRKGVVLADLTGRALWFDVYLNVSAEYSVSG